jgi:NAD+ diphosphatase
MPIPDLPVLPAEDSMLSRKFGREVANYFSGSPLNRVSFLRHDRKCHLLPRSSCAKEPENGIRISFNRHSHVVDEFLRTAFAHPSAAFLLVKDLSPLLQQDNLRLAFATRSDIVALTGPDPFEKTEEQMIKEFNSDVTHPVILFLGIDDKNLLPNHENAGAALEYKSYKGSPFFAVDVTPRGSVTEAANALVSSLKAKGLSFTESARQMSLTAPEGKLKTVGFLEPPGFTDSG